MTVRLIAPRLTTLTLSTSEITIPAGTDYTLSAVSAIAVYDNARTAAVSASWSLISGEGSVGSGKYTGTLVTGASSIRASYTEASISRTSDLKINRSTPRLVSITLSTTEISMPAGVIYNLGALTAFGTLDNQRTQSVSLAWSLVSGGGTVSGASYIFPDTVGDSVVRATGTIDTVSKFVDLQIHRTAPIPLSLTLSTNEVYVVAGMTYSLGGINTFTTYNNGKTAGVTLAWSIGQGQGSILNNTTYQALYSTGSTSVTFAYTENGVTVNGVLPVVVKPPKVVSLSANPNVLGYVEANTSSNLSISTVITAYFENSTTKEIKLPSEMNWQIQANAKGSVVWDSTYWKYTSPDSGGDDNFWIVSEENGGFAYTTLTIKCNASISKFISQGTYLEKNILSLTDNEELIVALYSVNDVDGNYYYNIQSTQPGISPAPIRSINRSIEKDIQYSNYKSDLMREEALINLSKDSNSFNYLTYKSNKNYMPSRSPIVNDNLSFYVSNNGVYKTITGNCRYVSNHAYFFEDAATYTGYQTTYMTPSEYADFANKFDNTIYPTLNTYFGQIPNPGLASSDIDNDYKLYILFSPYVSENQGTTYTAAYFHPYDQYTYSYIYDTYGGKSNSKDIIYMTCRRTEWDNQLFIDSTVSNLAHEMQHLINFNYKVRVSNKWTQESKDMSFLNEAMSQMAEDYIGYGYSKGLMNSKINYLLSKPYYYSLYNFSNYQAAGTSSLGNYGNSYLLGMYLFSRDVCPSNLIQNNYVGKQNIEYCSGSTFQQFYEDYITSLYLSNTNYTNNSKYSFKVISLRGTLPNGGPSIQGPVIVYSPTTPTFNNTDFVRSWGVDYYKISGGNGNNANIKITPQGSTIMSAVVIRYRK